jgi:hypothetical protein
VRFRSASAAIALARHFVPLLHAHLFYVETRCFASPLGLNFTFFLYELGAHGRVPLREKTAHLLPSLSRVSTLGVFAHFCTHLKNELYEEFILRLERAEAHLWCAWRASESDGSGRAAAKSDQREDEQGAGANSATARGEATRRLAQKYA